MSPSLGGEILFKRKEMMYGVLYLSSNSPPSNQTGNHKAKSRNNERKGVKSQTPPAVQPVVESVASVAASHFGLASQLAALASPVSEH